MRFPFAVSLALTDPSSLQQITSPTTPSITQPLVIARTPSTGSSMTVTTPLQDGIGSWLIAAAAPTPADIQILRQAFAEFYGVNRDLPKARDLLSTAIERWQNQPPEETAGLYRVRGDCHFLLADAAAAVADYSEAIRLIDSAPSTEDAPEELPVALLGRARANKSLLLSSSSSSLKRVEMARAVAADYRRGLQLTGRAEDFDTDEEILLDGIRRNPYAAWEWGAVLRTAQDYGQATRVHQLAAEAFEDIGDRARAAVAWVDAGLDAVGDTSNNNNKLLQSVVATKFDRNAVEGRDNATVQRVLTKQSEANMALAAWYWNAGDKPQAEAQLTAACNRLGKVQQVLSKVKSGNAEAPPPRLLFNIDDSPQLLECGDYRNDELLQEKLEWPASLRSQVMKLEKLR